MGINILSLFLSVLVVVFFIYKYKGVSEEVPTTERLSYFKKGILHRTPPVMLVIIVMCFLTVKPSYEPVSYDEFTEVYALLPKGTIPGASLQKYPGFPCRDTYRAWALSATGVNLLNEFAAELELVNKENPDMLAKDFIEGTRIGSISLTLPTTSPSIALIGTLNSIFTNDAGLTIENAYTLYAEKISERISDCKEYTNRIIFYVVLDGLLTLIFPMVLSYIGDLIIYIILLNRYRRILKDG